MDHTPSAGAGDDRPLRLLERTPVAADHKERLFRLVRRAQAAAAQAGSELQAEFGHDHVGLIVGCNQFTRLFRGGPAPGVVELLLDAPGKKALEDAGFTLSPPDGAVFRLFGWVRVDPMQGDLGALESAVDAAFAKARAAKATAKPVG
ncbi:MAG: hypothetical protein V4510_05845 [bacterium]